MKGIIEINTETDVSYFDGESWTEPLLDAEEAAEFLSLQLSILLAWRETNQGPAHIRVGQIPLYIKRDLISYMTTK